MDFTPNDQSKQRYHQIRDNLRDRTEKVTRTGIDSTASEFSRFGSALHAAASDLHKNNDYFAGLFDTLANKIDDVSTFVKKRESKDILNTVQKFAKQNPYLTMGGMFVAGLAISQFMKTEPNNYPQSKENYNESGT
ncbi:MAG TPA: hypothetical protein VHP36_01515 [Chitinispirillaceae bacterium]|nr:hypothetical protein [Chitinispirillaceae bacterium]